MQTDGTTPDPTAMPAMPTPTPGMQPPASGNLGTVINADDMPGVLPVPEPEPQYCRHCGEELDSNDDDALCEKCGRFQDTAICPTCKSIVRASSLDEKLVPEAHAPKRRKKAKGE